MVREKVSLVPYYITKSSRKHEQEAMCLHNLSGLLLQAELFSLSMSQFQVPKFRSNVHTWPIRYDPKQKIC